MPSGWKPSGSAITSGLWPLWCSPLPPLWATAGTASAAQSATTAAIRMLFMVLPEPPQVRLSDLHEHIRTHRGCGFAICEEAINLVPGEGRADADVMFVGEAPGRFEVVITNVVKARPPGNRDPTKAEVEHWMPVLEQQLALVAPRLVVPLGRHALAHFAPGARIG